MSPAVAWFWRAVALALFVLVMLSVHWGADTFFRSIPTEWMMLLVGLLFGSGIGFLIGADFGRKQERRPSSAPR